MHIDPLAAALWIADFLGSGFVLLLLIRFRLTRQWPSLAVLLSTDLVVWIYLAIIHRHYRWYFYTYWIWTAVGSALRLWLLSDCIRSIPGTSFISRYARTVILTAATLIALGAAAFALHTDGVSKPGRLVLDAVLLYNQAVSFAIMAFCASAFGAIAVLGLGWDRTGARIASGLGLELAVAAFRAAAFTEALHWLRALADYTSNFSHLLVVFIWVSALLTNRHLGGRPLPCPPHLERRVVQTT